jgi:2-polyprenyl-6-methoxyphenol hydroxylase-like FAD-dependent oxidoreductase
VIRQLDMRGLYHVLGGQDGPPRPVYEWRFSALPVNFFGVVDNPMHALLLQQPRLVRLLEKRARDLGVDLRWGHRLVGLEPTPGGVRATIESPDRRYHLDGGHLVGADGGRSLVRKAVGIDFPGCTSDTVARLAHVQLPEELKSDDGGYVIPGFGPLPFGHSRFENGMLIAAQFQPGRLLLGTLEFERPKGSDDVPMTIDELRRSTRRVLGVDLPIAAPTGPGPHALRRIDGQNSRQASTYREGNVLLLGDAAHVHSAMGGPGLNLGLQDAVNLGWKLAAQINGWAPDGLLDTYDSERRPAGERVMMQSLSQTALMVPGPEVDALRTLFGELLGLPGVRAHMARLLAGSDVRYDVGNAHPWAGLLAPELVLDDGRRIAELLHDARPVLVDASGGPFAAIASGWADRVDVVTASVVDSPVAGLLLRPDGYVAWATDSAEGPGLSAALERWFGQAASAT